MSSETSEDSPISSFSSIALGHDGRTIVFASFGGAVLDEIRVEQELVAQNSLGGAGAHATLGARLFLPSEDSTVAWTVLAGDDFPDEVEARLQGWRLYYEVRRVPGLLSTRNILTYHDSTLGSKTFQYQTPVIALTPNDVRDSKLLSAHVFHFHVSPELLKPQISDLLALRDERGFARPLILWEPTRPTCVSEHLPTCMQLVKEVDVFSPNHDELAALLGQTIVEFDQFKYEELAQIFIDAGVGKDKKGIVVVRAGEHGSLLMSGTLEPTWLPPFYEPVFSSINPNAVDTTGAGNSFLGGFGVGLIRDWRSDHRSSVRDSSAQLHARRGRIA